MKALVSVLVVGIVVWGWCAATEAKSEQAGEDVVTVRIKGQGIDQDAAIKDALRKALERGGHLEVFAQSAAENYVLVRDTVLAQVTGLVKDYRIVSEGEDPIGGYFVEIVAKIDRRIIDATWGQVQILLQQMGKPKILVNIVEKVNDMAIRMPEDRSEQASLLENKIEQLLVEKGFEVVDKNQIERLRQDKMEQASIVQDVQAMKQLAGELGAQMFIVGFARASGPQVSDAYGVRLFMWETDVTLKAIWSETGQILFSRSENGTRGGSRAPGPPGAKDAIAKAGDKMARECLQAILEKWSRQAVAGGKIILEVKGLDFKRMLVVQDGLKQIEGVRDVSREWHKPIAKFDVGTVHSAEQFAEILSEVQFPGFMLEVEDQKFNTIHASVVHMGKANRERQPVGEKPVIAEPKAAPTPLAKKPVMTAESPTSKPVTVPTTLPAAKGTLIPTSKPTTQTTTRPATQPSTRPGVEM